MHLPAYRGILMPLVDCSPEAMRIVGVRFRAELPCQGLECSERPGNAASWGTT